MKTLYNITHLIYKSEKLLFDWNNIWESTISEIFIVMFGGISVLIAYTLGI